MPHDLIIAVFLTTTLVTTGLLGVWAGTSPRHWFVRVAIVIAVLSPLLWANGHPLFLLIFGQIFFVAICVQYLSRVRRRSEAFKPPGPGRVRFSLSTILLAALVAAILLAIAVRADGLRPSSLAATSVIALVLAIPAVLGWGVATATARRTNRLNMWLTLVFLSILFGGVYWWERFLRIQWATFLIASVLIGVIAWSFRFTSTDPRQTKRSAPVHLIGWLLLLAMIVPPVYAYWQLVKPPDYVPQTRTDPNHYSEILALGQSIASSKSQQPQAELKRLRALIRKPVYVPVSYDLNVFPADEHSKIRQLARALQAEGDAEIGRADFDAAADWFLDTVRFGVAVRRDGLFIHAMVGVACTDLGVQRLYEHHQKMSLGKRKAAASQLIEIADQIDPYEEFARRERGWVQSVRGWTGRLWLMIVDIAEATNGVANSDRSRTSFTNEQMKLRLLATKLAVEAYTVEHGNPPQQLAHLAPEYLPSVPVDPLDPEGGEIPYPVDVVLDAYFTDDTSGRITEDHNAGRES